MGEGCRVWLGFSAAVLRMPKCSCRRTIVTRLKKYEDRQLETNRRQEMIRLALIVVAILLSLAAVAVAQTAEEEPPDSAVMAWVDNFPEAQQLGLNENRVILLDFYTDW